MICYNCGCELSEKDFCTSCGVDVKLYKKIMFISNRFYNDGLEKAGVRDLSGAIISLRQSVKFNKNNIEARNLLGLVYFEMGEVVAALSEWVISKNLRPNKNIADDYINMVQANATRLDSINQTIKKYNQALVYCEQDSKDLAIIQLKKVLSLNSKFIRAHQLLALIYINMEDWEKAKRELEKCHVIDTNNTTTLRYLKEVDRMLVPDDAVRTRKKKSSSKEAVEYVSGNETIIQPLNVKEHKSSSAMLNLLVGLAIGVAVAYFLILPARIQRIQVDMDEQLRVVSEQSDAKSASIAELESRLEALQQERDSLDDELQIYLGEEGTLEMMDELLATCELYLREPEEDTQAARTAKMEEVVVHLENMASQMDIEKTSAAFQGVYGFLVQDIYPQLAAVYYKEGYSHYRNGRYTEAIELLANAWKYDQGEIKTIYYLAESYRRSGDVEHAREAYTQVIERFPNTDMAKTSNKRLADLN